MKVFNSMSGRKEDFVPAASEVRMYVCGITPYDHCHLGHAMSYIVFDVIRRYLRFKGFKVKYVQNFTDVDDKIIVRSSQKGVSPRELADRFIAEYFETMDALNIERADVYPRVTEEIPQIVELVKGLVEKGHAYTSADGVYFRVSGVPDYGKLSHRKLDELAPGARVEPGVTKEHPLDFALWKAAKSGEPYWDSPWGAGRPGWHIECSAMSLKYLGETLDIHGGGQDLMFPHHENELVQSESFTRVKPFVRYWLHNGLVQMGEEKMSKSLGNLVSLREALERHSGDAIRLFVLGSHYRRPLTYSEAGLEAAAAGMARLQQAADHASDALSDGHDDAEEYRQKFVEAMDDDFNTPQAVSVLFEMVRDVNRARESGRRTAAGALRQLAGVLGLSLVRERSPSPLGAAPFVDLLVSLRAELRRERQWAMADKVRSSLRDLGVTLEDTPEGTKWRFERRTSQPGA